MMGEVRTVLPVGRHNRQHLNLSRVARPVVSRRRLRQRTGNDQRDIRADLPEQRRPSRHLRQKSPVVCAPLAGVCRLHDLWGRTDRFLALHGRLTRPLLYTTTVCVAGEIPGAVDLAHNATFSTVIPAGAHTDVAERLFHLARELAIRLGRNGPPGSEGKTTVMRADWYRSMPEKSHDDQARTEFR